MADLDRQIEETMRLLAEARRSMSPLDPRPGENIRQLEEYLEHLQAQKRALGLPMFDPSVYRGGELVVKRPSAPKFSDWFKNGDFRHQPPANYEPRRAAMTLMSPVGKIEIYPWSQLYIGEMICIVEDHLYSKPLTLRGRVIDCISDLATDMMREHGRTVDGVIVHPSVCDEMMRSSSRFVVCESPLVAGTEVFLSHDGKPAGKIENIDPETVFLKELDSIK